jgi:hypothetical protein
MEISLILEQVDCPTCGMICFFPQNFLNAKRRDYKSFFCGVGHKMNYTKSNQESPEANRKRIVELEMEVKQLKQDKAQLIHKIDQANIE